MEQRKRNIDEEDSILILVDVQTTFIQKLESTEKQRHLVEHIQWLTQVAKLLSIPLIVTAEDIPSCGGVVQEVVDCLPADTEIFNKLSFSLVGQAEIIRAVRKLNRSTVILVGLETDVCISQSALDLIREGFLVAVVVDAVGSPGLGQKVGLARMHSAGAALVSTKSLYYEWVRTVDKDNWIKAQLGSTTQTIDL